MKRCPFCGFKNDQESNECVKCNNHIHSDSSPKSKNNSEKNISNFSAPRQTISSREIKQNLESPSKSVPHQTHTKKISDSSKKTTRLDGENLIEDNNGELSSKISNCVNCGYLLANGQKTCPKCGNEVELKTSSKPLELESKQKGTIPLSEIEFSKMDEVEKESPQSSKKSFQLIGKDGQVVTNQVGENSVINRGNLDSENQSLSSNEHALIHFKDGQWFIKDKSTNNATFIQVRGEVAIKDGDLIILGDTYFIFKDTST